ncbi:hypothetical protein C1645_834414 [Glomus cerebriforme]|uniref:BTB domain-containing protein n=1 Tax=Glomus cerebriforme TaxID=658196 RepID=A0A397SJQ7_9GLOM|nr:hypothetical protein C1645_834414 [Glomus cerebriforme]
MVDNILLPKLSQHLLGVLNDEEYYDIIIEVGNDPYKNDGTLTHIKLPNISPETFQIILRYIYGGRLPLKEYDNLDMIKLLFAANELDLSSISEKLLISIIQNDNLQMSDIQIWEYNTLQQCIPFVRFYNLTSKEFSGKIKTFLNLLNHLDPDSKPSNKSKLENFEIDSRIITCQHTELISEWINRLEITDKLTFPFEFKLLFHGSHDGFTHNKFHEMCDNQSRTVTIVKVSFIFSFNNNDRIENYILSRVMNKKNAIFNSEDNGPSFGNETLLYGNTI